MSDYKTKDMCKMFGVTPITLRRWEFKRPDFPKRFKPGNGGDYAHSHWDRLEVDGYRAKLLSERHTVPVLDPDRDTDLVG